MGSKGVPFGRNFKRVKNGNNLPGYIVVSDILLGSIGGSPNGGRLE
jgi:hypothetical protein